MDAADIPPNGMLAVATTAMDSPGASVPRRSTSRDGQSGSLPNGATRLPIPLALSLWAGSSQAFPGVMLVPSAVALSIVSELDPVFVVSIASATGLPPGSERQK
jgi:hypothetical protein